MLKINLIVLFVTILIVGQFVPPLMASTKKLENGVLLGYLLARHSHPPHPQPM